ncbi:MAG: insulinase family protein [Lachnospiraceae bacterium]
MLTQIGQTDGIYTLLIKEEIEEMKGTGYLLQHNKTKARIVLVANEDDNKVFHIGFRTPPSDDTGVPHIIEHSVLCGSKEFPVKDPFVELAKGSMNTFLNAMTYPDKTVYPVASCNHKDYHNLMHVYLDAVFYPNIYQNEKILQQEGWHYELSDEEDSLTYNGVVYNEMKGVFSQPDQVLMRGIQGVLFPDTPYRYESGGDPEAIPQLTQEDFLAFHKKYYHPSNSYLYLYGDVDFDKELRFIDEHYLSHFDYLEVDSAVGKQEPFSQAVHKEMKYSVLDTDTTQDKAYLSYNVVTGDGTDAKLNLAMQIIDYILMEMPGAVLRKALTDAELGEDVYSSYEDGLRQNVYSIIVQNSNPEKEERFLHVVEDTLQKIVTEGLDERTVRGALNHIEFKVKEANFGRFPKGLIYGLNLFGSWLYDDQKPFDMAKQYAIFEELHTRISEGYFENIIQESILNNTHKAYVLLSPEPGLDQKKEEETTAKLAGLKANLSKEEVHSLILKTKELLDYQNEPSTQEDLCKIPMLTLEDLEHKVRPLYNDVKKLGDTTVVQHAIETNGIVYCNLVFKLDDFSMEEMTYASILTKLFQDVDTQNYSYNEFANEVNTYIGGLNTSVSVLSDVKSTEKCMTIFEVKGKTLTENVSHLFRLMKEMMFGSKFSDKKRIKEVLGQERAQLSLHMSASGHTVAMNRAASYIAKDAQVKEYTDGVTYYEFLTDILDAFDEKADELMEKLEGVRRRIFQHQRLLVSVTNKESLDDLLTKQLNMLQQECYPDTPAGSSVYSKAVVRNEGFATSSQVQYVATAGDFRKAGYDFHGSLYVLKTIFSYDYLWQNVRVKGGAYGCMFGFQQSGLLYFTSYRDPNLMETYEVYQKAAEYVRHFTIDDRDMVKNIIGAVSALDAPLEPSAEGLRSCYAFLRGVTEESMQQAKEELLATNQETIRNLAPLLDAVSQSGILCAIGGKEKIEANQEAFREIRSIF